ncbi:monofunctional biosynthetic peptidoglycan transglycosylase [Methylomagnum ishizawai]|nr:monofunctional biosynthetic peptidoglycan transglycosylase [Methylomagnum ishizawai]
MLSIVESPSMFRRKPSTPAVSWPGRCFRWLRGLVLGFVLLTVASVALLRWLPPPITSFMLIAQAEAIAARRTDFRLNYHWVDWDGISTSAKDAVIAAEDQGFFEHGGFDFQAIEQAWRHNQTGKRLRGGSTLSQQTAKNLFLYPGRSYLRKGLEAYFTVLIEACWPKERILEVYLNIAQFGDGIYGVAEAARIYFGKTAAHLDEKEAALLAAVLPNPIVLKAGKPSAYVGRRQQWIVRQMRQLGDLGV